MDAIVIGSGIGGLSCAAILSKAGKKVLVLEQHDQAGGCCHTFIEDGRSNLVLKFHVCRKLHAYRNVYWRDLCLSHASLL